MAISQAHVHVQRCAGHTDESDCEASMDIVVDSHYEHMLSRKKPVRRSRCSRNAHLERGGAQRKERRLKASLRTGMKRQPRERCREQKLVQSQLAEDPDSDLYAEDYCGGSSDGDYYERIAFFDEESCGGWHQAVSDWQSYGWNNPFWCAGRRLLDDEVSTCCDSEWSDCGSADWHGYLISDFDADEIYECPSDDESGGFEEYFFDDPEMEFEYACATAFDSAQDTMWLRALPRDDVTDLHIQKRRALRDQRRHLACEKRLSFLDCFPPDSDDSDCGF